jgi:hypothetical protein
MDNMKIALMCPTRNRMNKLMTLVSSLITTVKNPNNVKLILGVDADDPAFKYYEYLQQNTSFIELVVFQNHGKFLGLSTMWNTMVVQKDNFDIYAMIGDDMIFSTQNWDEEITHDFNNGPSDKILLVHCNDGMRGPGNKYENVPPLCVNFFIHKNYIKTTGYFVEPYMPNTHHDTWPQIVFNSLGRVKYRHDILIKHLHYSETTNKMDNVSSNLEKLRENIWDNNEWVKTYSKEMNEEIIKLREFIAIENK